MRVITTDTLEFEDFESKDPDQPYAMLSHVWGEEEVNYTTYEKIDKKQISREAPRGYSDGLSKILWGCHMARQDGFKYFWTDTCCINKSNQGDHTELDTSIRSMFKWYRNAAVCYAYLTTVTASPGQVKESHRAFLEKKVLDEETDKEKWISKQWFTRGWTLQELLAPRKVHFFNSRWEYIGSKAELTKQIQLATKIRDLADFRFASTAAKLSWAAGRNTTRPEDRIYSLFGIFDVSMDIRYGEGEERAFLRLQEQIIKRSPDESIFAWKSNRLQASGLLAPWIDCFADSGDVTYKVPNSRGDIRRGPYQLTNQGMEIPAPVAIVGAEVAEMGARGIKRSKNCSIINFPLFGCRRVYGELQNVTIKLQRTENSSRSHSYKCFNRIECNRLGSCDGLWTEELDNSSIDNQFRHIYVSQEHRLKPKPDDEAAQCIETLTVEPPTFSGEKTRYSKRFTPPKLQSQDEEAPHRLPASEPPEPANTQEDSET